MDWPTLRPTSDDFLLSANGSSFVVELISSISGRFLADTPPLLQLLLPALADSLLSAAFLAWLSVFFLRVGPSACFFRGGVSPSLSELPEVVDIVLSESVSEVKSLSWPGLE